MKYLVLFAVLAIAYLVWRNGRIGSRRDGAAPRPPAPPAAPQDMIRCSHCGVHVPRSDVRLGPSGRPFCSDEHVRLGGG